MNATNFHDYCDYSSLRKIWTWRTIVNGSVDLLKTKDRWIFAGLSSLVNRNRDPRFSSFVKKYIFFFFNSKIELWDKWVVIQSIALHRCQKNSFLAFLPSFRGSRNYIIFDLYLSYIYSYIFFYLFILISYIYITLYYIWSIIKITVVRKKDTYKFFSRFFTYLKSRKIEEKNPMLRKFLLDQNNFERVPLSSPFFKRFFEVKRVEIPLFLGAKTKIRCFEKKKGINSIIEDERKRMDKLTNRLAWKRKSGSSCCNSATICPRIIRLNRDDSRQRLSLPRITAPTRGSTRLSTLFTILKRRRFFFFCTLVRRNLSSPLVEQDVSIITLSMEYKESLSFCFLCAKISSKWKCFTFVSSWERREIYWTIDLWQVVTRTITRQYLTRWGKLDRLIILFWIIG